MRRLARRARTTTLLGAAIAMAVIASRGEAASPEPDPAEVARSLVEHYVLPRHRALAEATAGFETAVQGFCEAPGPERLRLIESAFHASVDAWLGVEPLQFGPIELLMRGPRMYFWPDPTDRTARDVAEFVAAGEAAGLEGARFQVAPVSLQGMPAAENVAFLPVASASKLLSS